MTREDAITYISVHCIGSEIERDGTQWVDAMCTAVEALSEPQIIQCEDCKWYGDETRKWYETCIFWVEKYGILIPTMPYDFCSYGKRKGGDTE